MTDGKKTLAALILTDVEAMNLLTLFQLNQAKIQNLGLANVQSQLTAVAGEIVSRFESMTTEEIYQVLSKEKQSL